jgi:hypothetical protein
MLSSTIIAMVLLLSWGLLAAAECPLQCLCRIDRYKHYIDCNNRNLAKVRTLPVIKLESVFTGICIFFLILSNICCVNAGRKQAGYDVKLNLFKMSGMFVC